MLLLSCLLTCLAVVNGATQCYTNLGCFHDDPPMPLPQSPDHVATKFELHRRGHTSPYVLPSVDYQSHLSSWDSHLDVTKPTIIIIHGFIDQGHEQWETKMVNELQRHGDYNVIVTAWGHGSQFPYEQAAANTFVVGAELALLLTHLHTTKHLQYSDVHLIGHSLGAQVAATTGNRVQHIGRITGLDPADPLFTGKSTDMRLDASDADFVDVIHTDATKFTLVAGYGTRDAVGDIDFYPNGGDHQPGCDEHPVQGAITNVISGSLNEVKGSITCSHSRSRDYFAESINSGCTFYGHLCPSADGFEEGNCLGCPNGGCPIMGFNADQTKSARGTYYLSTSGDAPFCGHEYFVSVQLADAMFSTYGEFLVTLVGTQGISEELKFESKMHRFHSHDTESHVISTHTNIGDINSVMLHFVRGHDLHSLLAAHSIRVHSVLVKAAETNFQKKFCAHEDSIRQGVTHTYSRTIGC